MVTRTSDSTFYKALTWKEPKRIFTCSWSDFFIEEADSWRAEAWNVILNTPQHTWMILTKRIERVLAAVPNLSGKKSLESDVDFTRLPKNVWLGTSVENARYYHRIEQLRQVDCPLRFLSIEPLLGRMADIRHHLEGIGWVIVGGESGPSFRPLNLDWVREIRDACVDCHIPFFFKQQSGLFPKSLDRKLDGREWDEIPQ